MLLVDAQEAARRVRAAAAYSGLEQKEISTRCQIGVSTLRRIVALESPRGASIEELWAIGDACGIPRWFMEAGWQGPAATNEDRLEAVERQITELRAALVALSAGSLQQAREQQEQDEAGRPAERPGGGG